MNRQRSRLVRSPHAIIICVTACGHNANLSYESLVNARNKGAGAQLPCPSHSKQLSIRKHSPERDEAFSRTCRCGTVLRPGHLRVLSLHITTGCAYDMIILTSAVTELPSSLSSSRAGTRSRMACWTESVPAPSVSVTPRSSTASADRSSSMAIIW